MTPTEQQAAQDITILHEWAGLYHSEELNQIAYRYAATIQERDALLAEAEDNQRPSVSANLRAMTKEATRLQEQLAALAAERDEAHDAGYSLAIDQVIAQCWCQGIRPGVEGTNADEVVSEIRALIGTLEAKCDALLLRCHEAEQARDEARVKDVRP